MNANVIVVGSFDPKARMLSFFWIPSNFDINFISYYIISPYLWLNINSFSLNLSLVFVLSVNFEQHFVKA